MAAVRLALGLVLILPSFARASSLRYFGNGAFEENQVKIRLDAPAVPADVGAGDFTVEFWMKALPGENTGPSCQGGGSDWINGDIAIDRDVYGNGDYGDYSANFTVPAAPFTTDASTVALYHFDEGSGDVIGDSSGAAGGPSPGVRRFGGSPAGPAWSTDTPFSTPPSPTRFYTLPPCRLADTRNAVGPSGGPALAANSTRNFPVAGSCTVPSTAVAVVLNATAVGPTDSGNLRLFAQGGALPNASALNFAAGRTRANNAVVPLGAGGGLDVRCDMAPGSTGSTHFVLDVTGYFQ